MTRRRSDRRNLAGVLTALVISITASPGVSSAEETILPAAAAGKTGSENFLPRPMEPFHGSLEPTAAESTTYLPKDATAPEGAPNILLVMTDDVGFASSSTFGGPVATPSLGRLAQEGVRYNQFHTVGVCSPTRASLLTGRNHHAVGFGFVPEVPSPYPGYIAEIPPSAATVARVLRDNGYSTAMFGKEHNVPGAALSTAGPFDQWPTGRGFDYFYGFIGGDSHQWQPALYENTTRVDSSGRPEDYLLDEELADRTINWIHNQKAAAPDKPFFIYYAPGTAHAPHHAPREWIEKYHGKFDHGWDVERERILARQKAEGLVPEGTRLTARPDIIPAWDSLSRKEKTVYARYMEVYAAMLGYQDAQFGRIVDELERMGIRSNTLIVFIQGDNGSSGEGGPGGAFNEIASLTGGHGKFAFDDLQWQFDNLDLLGGKNSYQVFPVGWAYATSTPFPWIKHIASHLGGTRNGLVISWPEQVHDTGEVRQQYHHVTDIMPTLLEAAGVKNPVAVDGIEQQALDGTSMVYTFDDPTADSTRHTQYYEILANRGMYQDGWLAATTPRNMPWNAAGARPANDPDSYTWELYNLAEDFSQSSNLAERYPERLEDLKALFDREARKNNVYPLDDSGSLLRTITMRQLQGKGPQREYTYWGPDISVPMALSPPIFFLGFSITAEIEVPKQGASGVLVAAGSHFGGWSFYLMDNVPVAQASLSPFPEGQARLTSGTPLSPGKHSVRFDFKPQGGGGILRILVDGEQQFEGSIDQRPLVMAGLGETFDTGRDSNVSVSSDYTNQGVFSGNINRITVEMKQ